MAENSKNEIPDYPWYSWGSPIGLGIWMISASSSFSVFVYFLAQAYTTVKSSFGG
ncbi:hypothetical protein [Leptospira licerasiae]|uniref:Uncharacterized protein n=1 Tax=Leptospira licerasiae str. MMD4847 TaxID=1049971 RepID=A0ABN0H7W9_9LEPT|nr:hypothetical protein [Leptospira licerasiae]EID99606.1 hypothetical protein LEP1GSC185_0746 [Leptospira licerasiae serovar Varillal str. VAR 010]EJZ41575.1 hypothetical protein LEP1GSC178_3800 [Leptospira licerasiae str. MMD4847]